MTIDEAIIHYGKKAEEQMEAAEWCGKDTPPAQDFLRCARHYKKMAEWLRELKKYRKREDEARHIF